MPFLRKVFLKLLDDCRLAISSLEDICRLSRRNVDKYAILTFRQTFQGRQSCSPPWRWDEKLQAFLILQRLTSGRVDDLIHCWRPHRCSWDCLATAAKADRRCLCCLETSLPLWAKAESISLKVCFSSSSMAILMQCKKSNRIFD